MRYIPKHTKIMNRSKRLSRRFVSLMLIAVMLLTLLPSYPLTQTVQAAGLTGANDIAGNTIMNNNSKTTGNTAWVNYLNTEWLKYRNEFEWTDTSALNLPLWGGTTATVTNTGQTDPETIPTMRPYLNGTIYEVWSGEQLYYALNVATSGQTVKLMRDIDLYGYEKNWPTIGTKTGITLDGDHHIIYNLGCTDTYFIQNTRLSTIKDIKFVSSKIVLSIEGETGIFGLFQGSNLYNVFAKKCMTYNSNVTDGTSTSTGTFFGKCVEYSSTNNVVRKVGSINCFSYGVNHVGGAFGSTNSIDIINCFAVDGAVISVGNHSGGFYACANSSSISTYTSCFTNIKVYGLTHTGVFTGVEGGTATYTNCYTSGSVEGTTLIGGFIAQTVSTSTCTFINCYSTSVTGMQFGGTNIGGFIGSSIGTSKYINCYVAGEVGASDVNVEENRNTHKTTGAFSGNNSGTFINCYYDMQTTAMKGWASGPIATVGGITGVYTTDTVKGGVLYSGLTSNPGTNGFNLPINEIPDYTNTPTYLDAGNLARTATISSPDGQQGSYPLSNMIDGALDTSWRPPSVGADKSIILEWPESVTFDTYILTGFTSAQTYTRGWIFYYYDDEVSDWVVADTVTDNIYRQRAMQFPESITTTKVKVEVTHPMQPEATTSNYVRLSELAVYDKNDMSYVTGNGLYPQSNTFVNPKNFPLDLAEYNADGSAIDPNWIRDLVRAYSQASVSTVYLETWETDYNGNPLPATVYDTVRDITARTKMTSNDVTAWTKDDTYETLYGESYPIVELFKINNTWSMDNYVPGIEWVQSNVTYGSVTGVRRMRIVPTVNFYSGMTDIIVADNYYDHADDVKLAFSTVNRLAADSSDMTVGIFPDSPLTTAQSSVQFGAIPDHFVIENDKYVNVDMNHMALNSAHTSTVTTSNAYNGKITVIGHEIDSIDSVTGQIILGENLRLDNTDSANAWNDKFNGIVPFDEEDAGMYSLLYIWELADKRCVQSGKIITVKTDTQNVTIQMQNQSVPACLLMDAYDYQTPMSLGTTPKKSDSATPDYGTPASVSWKLANEFVEVNSISIKSGTKAPVVINNPVVGSVFTVSEQLYSGVMVENGECYSYVINHDRVYTIEEDNGVFTLYFNDYYINNGYRVSYKDVQESIIVTIDAFDPYAPTSKSVAIHIRQNIIENLPNGVVEPASGYATLTGDGQTVGASFISQMHTETAAWSTYMVTLPDSGQLDINAIIPMHYEFVSVVVSEAEGGADLGVGASIDNSVEEYWITVNIKPVYTSTDIIGPYYKDAKSNDMGTISTS